MINFSVPTYQAALRRVHEEISAVNARLRSNGDEGLDGMDKDRLLKELHFVVQASTEYRLISVHKRLNRIYSMLRKGQTITLGEMVRQLSTLLEAFEDDVEDLYLYAYPAAKVNQFRRFADDWQPTLKAFSGLNRDVESATDLYALGQNLACVFMLMRIMESGVQRFGSKLKVSLTKRTATKLVDLTWHEILNGLNPKLNAISQKTAKGKAKFEKYSAIQSYLYRVKDAWRNPTMHPRKAGYNDLETLNLLNHVRSFMNELASVVSP